MSYAVGCVPYLNAKPLVWSFAGEDSPVRVQFDVPSRLPKLLDDGQVQAILVSSIEALRRPRVADGVSISSFGEVLSVRLFSRVPFEQIRTLALDQSSMTSNALAQILLAEQHGCQPNTTALPPELATMLDTADAGVLIGDAGMRADGTGLHVMDLGAAWTELTGLPFVWALWVGGDGLDETLAGHLADAAPRALANLDTLLPTFAAESGFSEPLAHRYFTEVMDYEFGEAHREGLAAYAERLLKHGLVQEATIPQIVGNASLAR
ncbi:MAG: menaquinone biosynthesis protein [Methanoregulaceae archaeon]|nr:menaquinone biosynthesis protein [Methanoregulaceae archaeon]